MGDYDDIFEKSIQIVPDAIPGGFSKNPRQQTLRTIFFQESTCKELFNAAKIIKNRFSSPENETNDSNRFFAKKNDWIGAGMSSTFNAKKLLFHPKVPKSA